jgi:hypothetical protein
MHTEASVHVLIIAALTLALTVPVLARDSSCKNLGKSGKATNVFQTLRKCERLYCSEATKVPATPSALKAMDETLTKQRAALEELGKLMATYEEACAKLVKKFCRDCADFETFQFTHLEINLKMADLHKRELETKDFQPALSKVNSIEGDFGCYKQITDLAESAAPTLFSFRSQFKSVRCSP